jgi:hypothetical protein
MLNKKEITIFFSKNARSMILGSIIFFGFFFRIFKVGNPSYWIDEGFTIMQAKAILLHGYPLLNSGIIEFKDVLLPYLLAGAMKIFGQSAFFLRLVPVIFGTLSVYAGFILGKKLFNEKVGIIFSFFLSFSYWHIAWSRQIRGYSLLVFFALLFFIMLVNHEEKGKIKYLYLALLSVVAAVISKSFGIILFPIFILYSMLKRKYVFALVVFCMFIILNIIFGNLLINALNVSVVNYFNSYVIGYLWKYFGIFFSLFIVGGYVAARHGKYIKREMHLLILTMTIFTLLFFSFFVYLNQKRYLFLITPFIFLYAAYLINAVSKRIRILILIISAVICIDFFTAKAMVFYPREMYYLEQYTPQPKFNDAYGFIKQELTPDDYIVSAYPYMDLIYLGKSSYAIAISYTGRDGDTSIGKSKEYYSGTKKLYGGGKEKTAVDKLEELRKKGDVYVVLDNMALSRIKAETRNYIIDSYGDIFQSDDVVGQKVYVYKLSKENQSDPDSPVFGKQEKNE